MNLVLVHVLHCNFIQYGLIGHVFFPALTINKACLNKNFFDCIFLKRCVTFRVIIIIIIIF